MASHSEKSYQLYFIKDKRVTRDEFNKFGAELGFSESGYHDDTPCNFCGGAKSNCIDCPIEHNGGLP